MARRSRGLLVVTLVGVLLVGLIGAFALGAFSSHGLTPEQRAAIAEAKAQAAARRLLAKQHAEVNKAAQLLVDPIPSILGAPAPPITSPLLRTPLPAHQVVGFAPYWELANLSSADFTDVTTLSYFSLPFASSGDGSVDESGPGWTTLNNGVFASFHAQARAAGDRVLLTVSTTSSDLIDNLVANPAQTSARLASQIEPLVGAHGFDGIDLDIEGVGSGDRGAFVTFISDLVPLLRHADPTGAIILDAYPQSASSGHDFFDVKALAPLVDQLFVMAYDMYDSRRASANSPILSPTLGLSDVQSLMDFVKVVPRSKIIFGLPFYGLDFTTKSSDIAARNTGTNPEAVTFSAILGVNRPARFDPASASLFTTFRYQNHWHQTWYDNPTTLALKSELAAQFGVAGVGVWALGQEGAETAMLTALTGGAAPVKLPTG